jgi:nucleoside-diphosphate-sugar epimerase
MTETGRILITGGAGYIGSALVRELLGKGCRVRVLDNLMHGGQGLISFTGHSGFQFVQGDIRDRDDVVSALKGIDSVVHLAAIVGDPACKRQPVLATEVNQSGSELLYDLSVKSRVKRFVFASTCSNYGRMPDHDGYVDESTPLNPISHYAGLKVGFEQHLFERDHSETAPVCLRFATVYGLSPRPRFDLTVNEFTRDLTLGKELEIFGEHFWRPYCHVRDLANACVMALSCPESTIAGEAFNVGDTQENYQKKGLAALLIEQLPEAKTRIRYVPREEDPRDYRVRFDKIRQKLGFGITRRVPDGIREIISAIRSGLISDPEADIYRNI